MIVAHGPEPRAASMLVAEAGAVAAVAPDGTRRALLTDARDAAYSPDGTLVAFVAQRRPLACERGRQRAAGARAHAERRRVGPRVAADGQILVYTASVNGSAPDPADSAPARPVAPDRREQRGGVQPRRLAEREARLRLDEERSARDLHGAGGRERRSPVRRRAARDAARCDPRPRLVAGRHAPRVHGRRTRTARRTSSSTTGTTQTVLSVAPAHDEHPVWSPTGSRIAFDDGAGNLASIAAGGGDRRNLGTGSPLDWQVVPAGRPKFPNLVQRPPSELVVTRSPRGRWLLGFTSMVDNRGPGILWIRGTRAPGAHVMQVRQLVQLDGGGTRVLPDSGELHYTVAPPHYHWHFLGFDRYELRRAGDLQVARARPQERLLHRRPLRDRDRRPARAAAVPRQLRPVPAEGPRRRGGRIGRLHRPLPGVLPRPGARHHARTRRAGTGSCTSVNADFHLREEHYGDDTASLLVQISWPDGRNEEPRVTTLRTCSRERC